MKKYLKENIKTLPFIIIVFVMLYSITTLANEYFFNSNEVKYDNSNSSLTATNVQDAIEELNTSANNYTSVVERLNNIGKEVYPVGSIYISVSNTNPQTIFGGTWEQLEDRFLLGAGSSYSAGTTGGEATHTLTVEEMPSHSHTLRTNASFTVGNNQGSGVSGIPVGTPVWGSYGNAHWYTLWSENSGGNQAHNNMPPYLVVYMWKRTS